VAEQLRVRAEFAAKPQGHEGPARCDTQLRELSIRERQAGARLAAVIVRGNYPRLLEIKKKYDPYDVFCAAQAVGLEGWAVKAPGRTANRDWPPLPYLVEREGKLEPLFGSL